MPPRRPGSITVTPQSDLADGESYHVNLADLTGGPRNKRGYLRKYLPFKAVVVDLYTGATRLEASLTGSNWDPVPPNSARTFDSLDVNSVHVRNPSGSGVTVAQEDIKLILFTPEGDTQDQGGWSPAQAVEDLIPGFRTGVRTDR